MFLIRCLSQAQISVLTMGQMVKKPICKVPSLFSLKRNLYCTHAEVLGWKWLGPHNRNCALARNLWVIKTHWSEHGKPSDSWTSAAKETAQQSSALQKLTLAFSSLCLLLVPTDAARQLMYTAIFITQLKCLLLTLFCCPVTALLSPAKVFEISQGGSLQQIPVCSLTCWFFDVF